MVGHDTDENSEFNHKFPLRITIMGEPGSGKTSISRVISGLNYINDPPITLGANFTTMRFTLNQNPMKIRICDITGHSSFESIRSNYMINSQGALFVFDLTNPTSFSHLNKWLTQYSQVNSTSMTPLILVGNKYDLDNERKISLSQVQVFLNAIEQNRRLGNFIDYIEVSAKTGKNVRRVLDTLSRAILYNS